MKRERRAKKRFSVKEGALAFLGTAAGTIIDISEIGVAVNYAVFEKEPENRFRLDIFFAEDDFYLADLEAELITDARELAASGVDAARIRRLGLRFCELKSEQKDQLRYFILHNATCEV